MTSTPYMWNKDTAEVVVALDNLIKSDARLNMKYPSDLLGKANEARVFLGETTLQFETRSRVRYQPQWSKWDTLLPGAFKSEIASLTSSTPENPLVVDMIEDGIRRQIRKVF